MSLLTPCEKSNVPCKTPPQAEQTSQVCQQEESSSLAVGCFSSFLLQCLRTTTHLPREDITISPAVFSSLELSRITDSRSAASSSSLNVLVATFSQLTAANMGMATVNKLKSESLFGCRGPAQHRDNPRTYLERNFTSFALSSWINPLSNRLTTHTLSRNSRKWS